MKKLLFQFDTDAYASAFDAVVAYDGGADQVIAYAGLTPEKISALVEGTIFTRAPKDKKNTAIFVGGGNMAAGQALFKAVQAQFFGDFRVSVMLDSNGGNTTAAAAVAMIAKTTAIAGKKVVVLAGTGPVGQRAAVLLAQEGAAEVVLSSRKLAQAQLACADMQARFGLNLKAVEAVDEQARAELIQDAQIVISTGAAGVELLKEEHWRDNPHLEVLADANTTPPLGLGGVKMQDKGAERNGKIVFGPLGFGPLKLALQRACIGQLFEQNNLILDAEEIYKIAKTMA